MKLLGAMLIFISFVFGGLVMWNGKQSRYQALNQLSLSFELAISELKAKNSPLPELIELLNRRCYGAVAMFYGELCKIFPRLGEMEFSEMWSAAAKKHLKALNKDELEAVKELGLILGRYELAEQLSALKHTFTLISTKRDAVRENYYMERKLCIGLCTALGALLAIVCI